MPEQHTIVDTTTEELREGASLRVVLYPDSKREKQPDSECYELPHLLMDRDCFWGSFGTLAHSASLVQTAEMAQQENDALSPSIPCAYAYSNRYSFVTIFSYLMNVTRFTETLAYERVHFLAQKTSRPIWRSGETTDFGALKACVEEGKKLRMVLTDERGLSVAHPVHTPEIYGREKRIRIYTSYDAMPKIFWDTNVLEKIGESLSELRRKKDTENSDSTTYLSTPLIFNSSFNATFYVIDCHADGRFMPAQWDIYKNEFFQVPGASLRLFAET